jgi:DNA-directed RNA polymerase subunit omega
MPEQKSRCFSSETFGVSFKQTASAAQADSPTLILPSVSKRLICLARSNTWEKVLNAELTRKALEKVGNPNVLVNLISRRVRQLNSGSGALSRPLVADTANLGSADIALLEIIEDKVGFEMPEITELTRPVGKKRKKH